MSSTCSLMKNVQSAFEKDVAGLYLPPDSAIGVAVNAQRSAFGKKFQDDESQQSLAHQACIEIFQEQDRRTGTTGLILKYLRLSYHGWVTNYGDAERGQSVKPFPVYEHYRFLRECSCSLDVYTQVRVREAEERFYIEGFKCLLFNPIRLLGFDQFEQLSKSRKDFLLGDLNPVDEAILDNVYTHVLLDELDNWDENGICLSPDDSIGWGYDLETGPGAVATSSRDSVVDLSWYAKFLQNTRTASNEGVALYVNQILMSHPLWASAENQRHINCIERNAASIDVGVPGQFFSVPKNDVVRRPCIKQPTDDMICQKLEGRGIEEQLKKRFNIDITTQEQINKKMAYLGSFRSGFSFCTEDSVGASNSIHHETVRSVLNERCASRLRACNVPTVQIEDSLVSLNTFCTMGNGFTFPLETYIFAKFCEKVYYAVGEPLVDHRLLELTGSKQRFGVFGDDIIVVQPAYNHIINVLRLFGFEPNEEKSFSVGYFRESCGGDYYDGRDVRPVFCKSLKLASDRLSLLNRLLRWGCLHGIQLRNCYRVLLDSVPVKERRPIPGWEDVGAGIIVPEALISSSRFARTARACSSADNLSLGRKYCPKKSEVQYFSGFVYERRLSRSQKIRKYVETTNYAGVTRVWEFPEDALVALLGGYLGENGTVTLRQDGRKISKVSQAYTPGWTVLPPIQTATPLEVIVSQGWRSTFGTVERQYAVGSENCYETYLLSLMADHQQAV